MDVRPIGQKETSIGFATFNSWFYQLTGVYMGIYNLTDWLGLIPIFICIGFGELGLAQLIRRSLVKVDRDLLLLGIYYILVILGYLIKGINIFCSLFLVYGMWKMVMWCTLVYRHHRRCSIEHRIVWNISGNCFTLLQKSMRDWREYMEFHEKLQKFRKEKGLTQEQLAQKLYVSRTAISKWESARD